MSALIEARGLAKSFGAAAAVSGVSFEVARGEITALIGPNGAGKSTTLRMLTGGIAPDAGEALIASHDVARDPTAARAMLGYLPESANGFAHLLPGEVLSFAAAARGLGAGDARNETRRVMSLLSLDEVRGQTLSSLSKGWRQRVWLGQALVGNPPVLILDEPTDGLDPTQKHALRTQLERLARDKAILMSTHILEEAEQLAARILVMARGKLVADARVGELADERGRLFAAFARLTSGAAAA